MFSPLAVFSPSNDTLTLDHATISANLSVISSNAGVAVGNGRVCMYASYSNIDLQRCLIASPMAARATSQRTNALDAFVPCKLTIQETEDPASIIPLTLSNCTLNMQSGMFESVFDSDPFTVHSRLRACRQFPNSVMHTLWIVPKDSSASNVYVRHEVTSSENDLKDVAFNSSTIYLNEQQQQYSSSSAYVFSGQGVSRMCGEKVAFASTYVPDPTMQVTTLGFNQTRSQSATGYCLLRLNVSPGNHVASTFQAGSCYKLHVLSSMFTGSVTAEDGYPDPMTAAIRMVLFLLNQKAGGTPIDSVHSVVSRHVSEWDELWSRNITIVPKTVATVSEKSTIDQSWNRHIRFAIYNIYSAVRDGSPLPLNGSSFPGLPSSSSSALDAVDAGGVTAVQSDLWLFPLLLALRPSMAQTLIEYRWQTLGDAIRRAYNYGMPGALYPSMQDDGVTWGPVTTSQLFASALVSICAWNYFRVVTDRQWLLNKGYDILRSIADFYVSVSGGLGADGLYHLSQVQGMNTGFLCDDQTMTNYLVRLALRYAIEASYECGMDVPTNWMDMYKTLPITLDSNNTNPDQFLLALPDSQGSADISKTYIKDVLLPLIPMLSYVLFISDAKDPQFAVQNSIRPSTSPYIEPAIGSALPFNRMLLAILCGVAAQQAVQVDNTTSSTGWIDGGSTGGVVYGLGFEDRLLKLLADSSFIDPVWGNVCTRDSNYYDLSMGAMFVMAILQGVCGVTIKGGVAETRFYYNAMGLDYQMNTIMPRTWDSVRVTGQAWSMLSKNVRVYTS